MSPSAPSSPPPPVEEARRRSRRNLRTTLWLTLLALGFYLGFFWHMSRPH